MKNQTANKNTNNNKQLENNILTKQPKIRKLRFDKKMLGNWFEIKKQTLRKEKEKRKYR